MGENSDWPHNRKGIDMDKMLAYVMMDHQVGVESTDEDSESDHSWQNGVDGRLYALYHRRRMELCSADSSVDAHLSAQANKGPQRSGNQAQQLDEETENDATESEEENVTANSSPRIISSSSHSYSPTSSHFSVSSSSSSEESADSVGDLVHSTDEDSHQEEQQTEDDDLDEQEDVDDEEGSDSMDSSEAETPSTSDSNGQTSDGVDSTTERPPLPIIVIRRVNGQYTVLTKARQS